MSVHPGEGKPLEFRGSITTSGNSRAVRFEAALGRACPEFNVMGAPVRAHYLGPGHLLLSVDANEPEGGADPAVAAWLAFLERDMTEHPERLAALTEADATRMVRLVDGVVATDDDVPPEDVTF